MDNNSVISDPNTPPRSPHLPSTSSPNPSTTAATAASSKLINSSAASIQSASAPATTSTTRCAPSAISIAATTPPPTPTTPITSAASSAAATPLSASPTFSVPVVKGTAVACISSLTSQPFLLHLPSTPFMRPRAVSTINTAMGPPTVESSTSPTSPPSTTGASTTATMPSSKIISSTASTIPITASTISTTSSKNSTTTSVNPTFTTTAQQSAPQVSPPTESSFPLTSVGPAYTGNPSSDVVSTTSSSPSSPSSTLTDATSVRSRKVAKLSLTDANAVVPFIDENKPKDLFPEVLFMIAGMLSLADVKRCVWVNKNWYASCCIHLWQEVGHFQWQNNTFPLLKVANDTNPVWNGHRRRIRKLSWSDDDNTVVDWCRMIGMLRGMPNLKEVTLIGRESAPPQAFLSFLQDSNSFRRVTSLHLEMDNFVQEPLVQGEPIPIKNVIQGVEYLKELHVGGPWFRDENEDELRADATIWNLERLTIPRMYLRLLRRCQRLQVLTLASPLGMGVGTPIAHITACANLEELTFAGLTAFNVDDSEMVVPAMQVLTTLIINHLSQDNHARLHVLVDAANLPSLSKVELARIPGAAGGSLASQILTQSNQAMLVRLLRARQGLRSFTLRGMCIRAHEFFTVNEEGQTTPTCPCPQLEELWQELHTTAYMESTPEVMNRHWTTTYSQIGSMPRLHTLTLKSLGLKVSAEAGFESLNHIETLKRLTLSIPHGHTWTVLELQTIMAGVPKLTSFKLTPIAPLNRKHVNAWLKMHGKRKLRF